MIIVEPIDKKEANKFVEKHHRHNDPVPEMQITFCIGMYEFLIPGGTGYKSKKLIGVVIIGNPCGRPTGPDRKLIKEVRRVCFDPALGFGKSEKKIRFHKLRRYYHKVDYKNEVTLRNIPIVVQGGPGVILALDATAGYNLPSKLMSYIDLYKKKYFNFVTKLWTYIKPEEDGTYLEKSGYKYDTTTWTKKLRYVKEYSLAA